MEAQNAKQNKSIAGKESIRSQNSYDSQSQSKNEVNTNTKTVITNQPTTVSLAQSMGGMDGHTAPVCAPGLEHLLTVNQLLIKEKVQLVEVLIGCEMKNKYSIQNTLGQNLFKANENSEFCSRCCCTQIRPLHMEISDNNEREVIHFRRPLRCDSCLCFCCLQEITVEAPRGNIIGYVIQEWSICYPLFRVENSLRQTVFIIEGPLITCSCCCGDVDFDVLAGSQRVRIGKISKIWSGCLRETLTDTDFFRVSFPLDLDVNMKAVLLSAAFLIDYIYFEN